MMSLLISLHLLATVVWVGGMFFAHMALRPAALATLEPPQRLPLWVTTFGRFFPWVWVAIILLLFTGLWMMFNYFGGMAGSPVYIHVMLGIGLLMMAIFMHIFFAPYQRLKRAVAAQDWPVAGRQLNQIRLLVTTNLILGLLTTVIASAGRYLAP
jgi:uncharacterized membrane protein